MQLSHDCCTVISLGMVSIRIFQDGKYTKFIAEKTGVTPQVEVSESGDLVVKLEGGTAHQIEQARIAVEDLILRVPKKGNQARQELIVPKQVCATARPVD